jgi:hypothetical protein
MKKPSFPKITYRNASIFSYILFGISLLIAILAMILAAIFPGAAIALTLCIIVPMSVSVFINLRYFVCPHCGGWLGYYYGKPEYCRNCGKKISWK